MIKTVGWPLHLTNRLLPGMTVAYRPQLLVCAGLMLSLQLHTRLHKLEQERRQQNAKKMEAYTQQVALEQLKDENKDRARLAQKLAELEVHLLSDLTRGCFCFVLIGVESLLSDVVPIDFVNGHDVIMCTHASS